MATLVLSEFVFRSGTAPNYFTFSIVSDQTGILSVRDLQDRYGTIYSPQTQIPRTVTDDIGTAMAEVEGILALTSAINGTVTFTAEASRDVTFAEAVASTAYRVQLSSAVFAPFRITNKTIAGFTIQAGSTISGQVGYDVFL